MSGKKPSGPAGGNGASAGAGAGLQRDEALPKRFYKDVEIKDDGDSTSLLLDGKAVRTPGKALLALPTLALSEAVAEEWRAQKERIDPATMPLTKLANSAIDGVSGREDAVVGDIASHAGSDLVCYRVEGPEGLVAAQALRWDPVLAWANDALGAPLRLADGVMPVEQPASSLHRIRQAIEKYGPFELAALHVMTQLTGSALLALAVALKRLTPQEAWEAAHVDEDWQIEQWGDDAETASRRAHRRRDFDAAARMLELAPPA